MAKAAKPVSKVKLVFAGIGVIFCVVFAVKVVSAVMKPAVHHGPSDLALHPDKQNEILGRQKAEELKEKLGLTDEQTAQVAEIIIAAKNEGAKVFEQNADNPDGRMSQGMTIIQGVQDKIEVLLTPEQKEKFDELKRQRKERMQKAWEMFRKKE